MFGYVRRDFQGELTVSDAGCNSEEPWLASYDTPAAILAAKQQTARNLLIGAAVLAAVSLGSAAYVVAKRI